MNILPDTIVSDSLFPTDNALEVPTLDIDMQAELCDIPFLCFGEQRRSVDMQGHGTLHFYTDDYRFRAIYEHPDRILRHHPRNIVEPNYSLFADTPIAFGLQEIYKKRWLARSMQEMGIRTFVDLNVAPKYYQLNMLGVPIGWQAFATRGYADRINQLAFELEIAKSYADGLTPLFVVYGGGKPVQAFCRNNGCVYITPVVTCKKRAASFDKMRESIAFFGTELRAEDLLPPGAKLPAPDRLLDEQIQTTKK